MLPSTDDIKMRQAIWNKKQTMPSRQQGWEFRSTVFWANRSSFAKNWVNEQFAQKNEQFAQKNEQFAHFWWATWAIRSWSLIFGEQHDRIAHGRSFLVSGLSDSLTSLTKNEGMSESLIFLNKKTYIKHTKK